MQARVCQIYILSMFELSLPVPSCPNLSYPVLSLCSCIQSGLFWSCLAQSYLVFCCLVLAWPVGFCRLKCVLKSFLIEMGCEQYIIWQNTRSAICTHTHTHKSKKQYIDTMTPRWCFIQLFRDLPSDVVPVLSEWVIYATFQLVSLFCHSTNEQLVYKKNA